MVMRQSLRERATSVGPSVTGGGVYNVTRGLRAVYCGSAFLPAFVLEGLHG